MTEIYKEVTINESFFYLGQRTPNEEASALPVDNASDQEQLRVEGYELGFNQGLREGLQQGKEQALKQDTELREQLKNILHTIPSSLSEGRLALRTEIADIVFAISQQFFIHQQQNKETIAQQIMNALNQVNDKQAITLSLNPDDLALLQQGELEIDFSQCKELRLKADPKLRLGGCLIRSEHGLFDASIEGQIERLKQVLVQLKERSKHE